MAKKSKKVKRDNGGRRVTCFFFHGNIDKLGDELSKALKQMGLKEIVDEALKNSSKVYTQP